MAVGVVRLAVRGGAGRVEVLADVEIRAVVPALAACALVARPAEVVDGQIGHRSEAVDLFPVVPAHVPDPDVVRAGADCQPEGISQALGDDAPGVRIGAEAERIAGEGGARVLVDANHGPVERDRVSRRAQILAPERTSLGRRRCQIRPRRPGRVPARVDRVAVLAPVCEVEARPVASAHVEGTVRAECELADGVTRVLLAPVLDEHLLGPVGNAVRPERDSRQAAADHAAVSRGAWRSRAGIREDARRAPPGGQRADRRVVRVQHVEEALGRVVRVDCHPEHPAVPEVVGVRAQVDRRRRRAVVQAVERLDATVLLGDEHAAVGGKPHGRRVREPREDRRLLEVGLQRGGRCRRGRHEYAQPKRQHEHRPPQVEVSPPAHH